MMDKEYYDHKLTDLMNDDTKFKLCHNDATEKIKEKIKQISKQFKDTNDPFTSNYKEFVTTKMVTCTGCIKDGHLRSTCVRYGVR